MATTQEILNMVIQDIIDAGLAYETNPKQEQLDKLEISIGTFNVLATEARKKIEAAARTQQASVDTTAPIAEEPVAPASEDTTAPAEEEPAAQASENANAAPAEGEPVAQASGDNNAAPAEGEPVAQASGDTNAAPAEGEPAAQASENTNAAPAEGEPVAQASENTNAAPAEGEPAAQASENNNAAPAEEESAAQASGDTNAAPAEGEPAVPVAEGSTAPASENTTTPAAEEPAVLIPEVADTLHTNLKYITENPFLQSIPAKCNNASAEQEFIRCQQKQKESHAISLAFFAPGILKFSSVPWEASLEVLAHAQEFYQTRWTLRHEAASNVLTSLFDESFAQMRLHSLLAQHDTLLPPPVPGRQIGFTPEQIELRNHLHEVQIPAATGAAEQAARAVTVAIEAEQAANQVLVQSQRPFLDAQIGERAARVAPPQLWHSTLSAVLSVMENPHGIKYVCYSMFPESCGTTTNEVISLVNSTTPGAFLIANQQTIWWGTWTGGHTALIAYGASPSHALRYFVFNRIKAAFDHIKPQVFTDSPALCLLDAAMDGAVNAIGAAPFGYPGMIGAAVLGSVVSGASCLAKGRINKDVGHTPYIADAAALLGVGVAVLKGGMTLFGGPVGTTLFAINTVASVDHLTKLFVSTSSQDTASAACTPISEAPQSTQAPVGEVALENHA